VLGSSKTKSFRLYMNAWYAITATSWNKHKVGKWNCPTACGWRHSQGNFVLKFPYIACSMLREMITHVWLENLVKAEGTSRNLFWSFGTHGKNVTKILWEVVGQTSVAEEYDLLWAFGNTVMKARIP
jgi:hypothetical protein